MASQTQVVEWTTGTLNLALSTGVPIKSIWIPVPPDSTNITFKDHATGNTFYILEEKGGEIIPVPFLGTTGAPITSVDLSASPGISTPLWVFFTTLTWNPFKQDITTSASPSGAQGTVTISDDVGLSCDLLFDSGSVVSILSASSIHGSAVSLVHVENSGVFDLENASSVSMQSDASRFTVNGGTFTCIGGSLTVGNSAPHTGLLTVGPHGTLAVGPLMSEGASVTVGFAGDGTLNIGLTSSASLICHDDSSFTLRAGTLDIEGVTITLLGNSGVQTPNGAVLANFTHAAGSGHTVNFTDHSYSDGSHGSVTSWAWNFGDSGTSTSQNPSHTYASAGTYTVTLVATTSGARTSTITLDVVVS